MSVKNTSHVEIKMYYLKVLDRNNKKQICEIAISTYVYNYLADELSQIPQNKKEALNYSLVSIEKGASSVAIGCYAAVLHALNYMDKDLLLIAKDDELGPFMYRRRGEKSSIHLNMSKAGWKKEI